MAPALGGECYMTLLRKCGRHLPVSIGTRPWGRMLRGFGCAQHVQPGFNWHPPLGANATGDYGVAGHRSFMFQLAPALGGECYSGSGGRSSSPHEFQLAPALGGECYAIIGEPGARINRVSIGTRPWGRMLRVREVKLVSKCFGFNWHPPLGANATHGIDRHDHHAHNTVSIGTRPWGRMLLGTTIPHAPWICFNWHPPLGANATRIQRTMRLREVVSIGTRPWGRMLPYTPRTGIRSVQVSIGTRPWGRMLRVRGGVKDFLLGTVSIGTRPWGRMLLVCPIHYHRISPFQLAPALGGECYSVWSRTSMSDATVSIGTRPWGRMLRPRRVRTGRGYGRFQLAPALGGECYVKQAFTTSRVRGSFNWHPPLGANATV